jgi:hypothetical protein
MTGFSQVIYIDTNIYYKTLSILHAVALPIPTRKPLRTVNTLIIRSIIFFVFSTFMLFSPIYYLVVILDKIRNNRIKPSFEVVRSGKYFGVVKSDESSWLRLLARTIDGNLYDVNRFSYIIIVIMTTLKTID